MDPAIGWLQKLVHNCFYKFSWELSEGKKNYMNFSVYSLVSIYRFEILSYMCYIGMLCLNHCDLWIH